MHATFNSDLLSTLKLILKKENGENKNRKKGTKMIQYDKQFKKKNPHRNASAFYLNSFKI